MVVRVTERAERQRSSYTGGRTTHTRVFQVECDSPADGTATALKADDGVNRVPGHGDFYRGVPFVSKNADRVANSLRHYEVECEFSGPGDGEQDDIHPLDREPDVSFGSDGITEPYFLDKSDPPKPVCNSATEAPDQFFERERGDLTLNWVRNVEYWNAPEMATYGNTINADGVYIDGTFYPELTLKMSPPVASRQVETVRVNGVLTEVVYYRASFGLKYRAEGWSDKLADYGYSEMIEKPETVAGQTVLVKKIRPIYDQANGTLRKPHPLNGLGQKMPSPADPPAELEFKPYTVRSWAALYF